MNEETRGGGASEGGQPALSICIPTHDRPELMERALASAFSASGSVRADVEIVVSDNSDDDETERRCRRLLAAWDGTARHVRIPPTVDAVGNFNSCVQAARGRFVHILHDDDYLLPGSAATICRAIATADPQHRVLLFGVQVVDGEGRVLRRQRFRSDRWLPPAAALERVLSNSSFVRFPAIVVRADAYEEVGPFDRSVGGATDLDMWVRLFGLHGVRCLPSTTCAYTVHQGGWTTRVFNAQTVATIMQIFDERALGLEVLEEPVVRRCQSDFFHQFILGGAVRRLRARDRRGARDVMRLFALPEVRQLGVSRRWLPVRLAMVALTAGPVRSPGHRQDGSGPRED